MKVDGGPAFPVQEVVSEWSDKAEAYVDKQIRLGGMTLRDYFAAKALAGGISSFFDVAGDVWEDYGDFAKSCYLIADAMIAERAK